MERFKNLIRKAIAADAEKIIILAEHAASLQIQSVINLDDGGDIFDQKIFETIFRTVLPKASHSQLTQPAEGMINIPGLGKLSVIGLSSHPAIVLYMPKAIAEMKRDLENLDHFCSSWPYFRAQQSQADDVMDFDIQGGVEEEAQMEVSNLEALNEGVLEQTGNLSDSGASDFSPMNFAMAEPSHIEMPSSGVTLETGAQVLGSYTIDASNLNLPPAVENMSSGASTDLPFTGMAWTAASTPTPSNLEFDPLPQANHALPPNPKIGLALPPSTQQEIIEDYSLDMPFSGAPVEFAATQEVEEFSPGAASHHAVPRQHQRTQHLYPISEEEVPVIEERKIDFGPDDPTLNGTYSKKPIDDLLINMIKIKSSDLHLTLNERVIYRVDGEITRIDSDVVTPAVMKELLDPIIYDRNRKEFLDCNDTDLAYAIPNVGRFRVNIFRDRNGVGSVIRHIPSNILTMEQLKLPQICKYFCELNKGLVLVTGPTGSGKSTTLAAMLDYINKTRAEHLITIEDPIEFVHPQIKCLVNQREVHRHTQSFSRALRAALREDPDIVLIGELRDLETIAIAIETAETGHLVFGTLHTTTAVSTVDRIIDQFPSDRQEQIRMMLSSSLKGVVSQTLIKKIGGGRVAAQEILVTDDAVSAMIREGKNHMINNHLATQKSAGNQLLNAALLKHVQDGNITADDAYLKSVEKKGMIAALQRANIKFNAPSEGLKSA